MDNDGGDRRLIPGIPCSRLFCSSTFSFVTVASDSYFPLDRQHSTHFYDLMKRR